MKPGADRSRTEQRRRLLPPVPLTPVPTTLRTPPTTPLPPIMLPPPKAEDAKTNHPRRNTNQAPRPIADDRHRCYLCQPATSKTRPLQTAPPPGTPSAAPKPNPKPPPPRHHHFQRMPEYSMLRRNRYRSSCSFAAPRHRVTRRGLRFQNLQIYLQVPLPSSSW